jgi:hypothetical protein
MAAQIKRGTFVEGVENRVLRRIFGPKRDEVTGERRKLHNEVPNLLVFFTKYYSGGQIEKNEIHWTCSTYR